MVKYKLMDSRNLEEIVEAPRGLITRNVELSCPSGYNIFIPGDDPENLHTRIPYYRGKTLFTGVSNPWSIG